MKVEDCRGLASVTEPGSFMLVGLPAELVLLVSQQPDFVYLRPLTYGTGHSDRESEKDSLLLDYRVGGEDKVPDAGGMSGSLILRFPEPPDRARLWNPGSIVAMLYRGDKAGTYVRCRPLNKVFEWLSN